jgi:hypothetical protein
MKKMIVLDKNNNELFVGTKQDCMHFIKVRRYQRDEIKVEAYNAPPLNIYTTAPSELKPEPKGFFKRIFS